MDGTVTVQPEISEAPDTTVWNVTAPVRPATGRDSQTEYIKIGQIQDLGYWMAIVRYWDPWLSPEHGREKFTPSKDVILCSFLRRDGLHLVLLALSGIGDVVSVFKADADGNVVASARNDSESTATARIVAAVGRNHEAAVAAVMYQARRIVRQVDVEMEHIVAETKACLDKVKPEWMENWYEGLTYCTWNGLGQNLSESKILEALRSLQKSNIQITNLIIDDNWQSLDMNEDSQFRRGWADFEANVEGFPNGLKSTISKIREEHKDLKHIAVWHALLGYWGGIAPNSKLSAKYKTIDVLLKKGIRPPGGTIKVIDKNDVPQFYDDFYRFLYYSGIDSVKTDAQFFIDDLEDADDRRRLITTYQDAWTISSLRWFSIKAISCMSQAPQILFHTQLPTNKPRFMVRNSDDFFPDVPASHPWHIFCNAHNSLLTQHLNLLPDWDMFQTSHPWAAFHAAARCISGGPIYITDVPGEHDISLITQMTARTTRGNTVIMRPNIGKTTQAYISYDEPRLVKIGTYTGMQQSGTGIVGLFNVSQSALTELMRLDEFPGVVADQAYVVRAHSSGLISRVLRLDAPLPLVTVDVPVTGWEILSAYPIQTHQSPASSDDGNDQATHIAVLGLLGKMTGAAAVVSYSTQTNTSVPTSLHATASTQNFARVHLTMTLKALGVLGVYISTLPTLSIEEQFLVVMEGRVVPLHTVRKAKEDDAKVLEIDVDAAWTEMGLSSAWSNEAVVQVFIT
ncbi:MAG: hypothetical protein M1838_004673 [Thelocarpon superellum]|nr:MAG: hypothetical protein M1838_004673 [Thelocarpon superellum]